MRTEENETKMCIISADKVQISGRSVSAPKNDEDLVHLVLNKSTRGFLDADYLSQNLRQLDTYYTKKLQHQIEVAGSINFEQLDTLDDRIFINSEGRLRTPIKLISPLTYFAGRGQSPPIHK